MDIPTLAENHRLVILDLDGTLYDKKGLSRRMVLHAPWDMLKMLAERKTRAEMKGIWQGEGFAESYYQRMAQRMHCSEKKAQAWYEKRYMPLMVRMIGKYQRVNDWVIPFVEECRSRGVKIVVLSDYTHAKEKLEALGLDTQVYEWVGSTSELGGLKPAAELMQTLTERMGVAAASCLVIGDREDTDGEMARKAGADFCLVFSERAQSATV